MTFIGEGFFINHKSAIFTAVKLLSIILSIYLIVLSCLPCADVEEVASNNKVAINNESSHAHDNDSCSPLCICNCCGCQSFVFNAVYNFNLIPVKTLIDKTIPEYKSILYSSFFGSIWQPPQII